MSVQAQKKPMERRERFSDEQIFFLEESIARVQAFTTLSYDIFADKMILYAIGDEELPEQITFFHPNSARAYFDAAAHFYNIGFGEGAGQKGRYDDRE